MTLYLGIRKGGNFEKKRTRFKLITPIFSVSKKCMLEQKGKRKMYFSSFFFFLLLVFRAANGAHLSSNYVILFLVLLFLRRRFKAKGDGHTHKGAWQLPGCSLDCCAGV
jgi:hypothetical protein